MTGPLAHAAFAARARPFLDAGILAPADVHVVDLLAPLAGETDPEAMLGLAFAVRAPRQGHVGADLHRVGASAVRETGDGGERLAELPWPDGTAWLAAVAASPLAGPPEAGRPFVLHGGLVLTRRYWRYQERLAAALRALAGGMEPGVRGAPLDEHLLRGDLARLFEAATAGEPDLQRLGALVALVRPLAVISGGPGTGKTFTVKKILALLHAQWAARTGGPPRVALAAPTGKAAVRMVEALRERLDQLPVDAAVRAWLNGLEAATLHRLLGSNPRTPGRFRYGRDRPLPHDLVVVDEASMVDLALMCHLVEAVGPRTRLVLLGDRNQLASVEAGSVLADLTAGAGPRGIRFTPAMAARVRRLDPAAAAAGLEDPAAPPLADAVVHLRRPFRFAAGSGIGRVAYALASGVEARLDTAVAWLRGEVAEGEGPFADVDLVPLAAAEDGPPRPLDPGLVARLAAGWQPCLEALLRGALPGEEEKAFHARVLALLDHYRLLAAHRRGVLGVEGLNRAVEDHLAEVLGAPAPGREPLRRDDPWWTGRPVLVTRNSYEVGRMNGDVGIVVEAGPTGRVAFPGTGPGEVDLLEVARLPPHETVFAMTVHKSQGSQFRHAVVVLPDRPSPILTRELVYTAATRAAARLTVVGPPGLLRESLDRQVQRASSLGLLLGAG